MVARLESKYQAVLPTTKKGWVYHQTLGFLLDELPKMEFISPMIPLEWWKFPWENQRKSSEKPHEIGGFFR